MDNTSARKVSYLSLRLTITTAAALTLSFSSSLRKSAIIMADQQFMIVTNILLISSSFFRVLSTIMQVKLLLLLVGFCAISLHKVFADDDAGMFFEPLSLMYTGIYSLMLLFRSEKHYPTTNTWVKQERHETI